MGDYISSADFRTYIKDTSSNDQPVIDQCIDSAERAVEKDCARFFTADTSATAHIFAADSYYCCDLYDGYSGWDIPTTSGLIVKTDDNGDGAYETTWTLNTDYVLEPVNQARAGIRGWPYESIRALGTRFFPTPTRLQPYPVQVTAKWGWAAVPAGVVQAALLMAAGTYKRSDAPFGVAGFDAFGAVRVRSDPLYQSSLAPFVRVRQLVG